MSQKKEHFRIDAAYIEAFKNALELNGDCYATQYELKDTDYIVTIAYNHDFSLFFLGQAYQIEKRILDLKAEKNKVN